MEQAQVNSREGRNEELTQKRAQAAGELSTGRADDRNSSGSDPISMRRRLDVDAVLERSVRKVVTE